MNNEYTYVFFKKDAFEDFEENVICPLCGELSENVDCDDYIEINLVMWCRKHHEILLCIHPDYMNKLYEGVECGCIKMVNIDEVKSYYNTKFNNIIPIKVRKLLNDDYYIYKCGVLKINKIISSSDKIFDDDKFDDDFWDNAKENPQLLEYHNVDIISFSECEYDTSHDGIYLYYNGKCMHCNKNYESFIWGD